jgi:uncharacterized protein
MANAITWFQIPCTDFTRAKRFYETILGITLQEMPAPGMQMAGFPTDPTKGEVGGAIVSGMGVAPSSNGTTVFLNANPNLQVVLERVPAAGGKALMPKTKIEMEGAGYFAMISDTEGNTVGLHSMA